MSKHIKKILPFSIIFLLIFSFTGCGGAGGGDATADSTTTKNNYQFKNATTPLKIDTYRPYEISFQLTKDNLVQSGKIVTMKAFDKKYGSVVNYTVITDENGIGTFTYNPPITEPDTKIYTLEYSYQNELSQEIIQNIVLDFNNYTLETQARTTALSLVYMSTIYEDGSGEITNRYRVHAVDSQSNQPRVGIPVSMSLINNAKLKQNNTANGILTKNGNIITFYNNNNDINYSIFNIATNDNLIILPTENRLDAKYLGGWIIEDANDTNLTLSNSEANITTVDKLTYIVGNEVRLVGDTLAVADVVNVNNDNLTDEDGYIMFDVTFDPKLAGHTVTLEAHGEADGQRVGVSQISSFRFDNINAEPYVIDDVINERKEITLTAIINNSEPLSNLELDKDSFHTKTNSTSTICHINQDLSNFNTDKDGKIKLIVDTHESVDDNGDHVVTTCTISWDGGMSSIYREY